jgi:antitoxin YefM
MTTLPLGEVKSHLSELVGRVHDHHERVTVTVHGHPSAVLVALEELEQLEETLAILRDADTMRRLASSDAELAQGESVSAGTTRAQRDPARGRGHSSLRIHDRSPAAAALPSWQTPPAATGGPLQRGAARTGSSTGSTTRPLWSQW